MSTRMYEVQQKVFGVLNSDPVLSTILNGVFDYVPETTETPYVTFGAINSSSSNTKIEDGEKVSITLDVWSETKGRKQTVEIIKAIEEALKNEIQLDSASLIDQKILNRNVVEIEYGLYQGSVEAEFTLDWED